MFRAISLLIIVLLPVALFYVAGMWAILAVGVLTVAVFLLSTRQGQGAEADQGGRLTGYRNTGFGATGFGNTGFGSTGAGKL